MLASQHEIKSILEIELDDGSNFIDALVDVFADGIAHPGKHPGRAKALFTRMAREKAPGTDETYAQQVESVKARLRGSFQRDFTPQQRRIFQAWEMDPTEIKDIEGSPWKALEARILERAQRMGAARPPAGGQR